jgi:hypothetical protein
LTVEILAVVLVACLLVAAAGLGFLLWKLRPAAPAPSSSPAHDPWAVVTARRVVVNLKTGRAVDGLLVRKDGPLLFLKNAVLLEVGSEPAAIDGEAVVHAGQIDFIQAL